MATVFLARHRPTGSRVVLKVLLETPDFHQSRLEGLKLKDMVLVKNSRLSVQPVLPEEWAYICKLGGVKA